jgi:hypothetical protein
MSLSISLSISLDHSYTTVRSMWNVLLRANAAGLSLEHQGSEVLEISVNYDIFAANLTSFGGFTRGFKNS